MKGKEKGMEGYRPTNFTKSLRHSVLHKRETDIDLLKQSLLKRSLKMTSQISRSSMSGIGLPKAKPFIPTHSISDEKFEKMKQDIDRRYYKKIRAALNQVIEHAKRYERYGQTPNPKYVTCSESKSLVNEIPKISNSSKVQNQPHTESSLKLPLPIETGELNSRGFNPSGSFNSDSSKILPCSLRSGEKHGKAPCFPSKRQSRNLPGCISAKSSSQIGENSNIQAMSVTEEKLSKTSRSPDPQRSYGHPNFYKGLVNNTYNKRILTNHNMQHFILKDELNILIEKIYNMKLILQRGVKVKISEVLAHMSAKLQNSLSLKIQKLCGYLYYLGNMLLQELLQMKSELGIQEMEDHLAEYTGARGLVRNTELLCLSFEHIRSCVYSFQIMQLRDDRRKFAHSIIKEILTNISKSRFLVNSILEEYLMTEQSVEKLLQEQYVALRKRNLTARSKPTKVEEKTDKILFDKFHQSEEIKLNSYIQRCLNKLIPKPSTFVPSPSSSTKKNKFDMEISLHNLQTLKSSMKILKFAQIKPTMRAQAGVLEKELKEEYDHLIELRSKFPHSQSTIRQRNSINS